MPAPVEKKTALLAVLIATLVVMSRHHNKKATARAEAARAWCASVGGQAGTLDGKAYCYVNGKDVLPTDPP